MAWSRKRIDWRTERQAVDPSGDRDLAAARPIDPNPHLILPVGTQVVALVEVRGTDGKPVHPRGAVGVVVQSPADYWHSYRVRFPDGFEASLRRAGSGGALALQEGG